VRGQQVNEALLANTRSMHPLLRGQGLPEGHRAVIVGTADTLPENSVLLIIEVDKGRKVKIKDVTFEGNEAHQGQAPAPGDEEDQAQALVEPLRHQQVPPAEVQERQEPPVDLYNDEGYRNAPSCATPCTS
jgi:outer membrane protein insertion porin family